MLHSGAKGEFVEALVTNSFPIEFGSLLRAIRIYLLTEDYDHLTTTQLNDAATSILTGLLSQQVVSLAPEDDLHCSPVDSLTGWNNRLLKLGICYGRSLLSVIPPSSSDLTVFQQNGVACRHDQDEITDWIISGNRQHRIVGQWHLVDGGNTSPSSIFGNDLLTAGEVTIYDRYFSRHSLDAIAEALDHVAASFGTKPRSSYHIYLGDQFNTGDHRFVDDTTISRELLTRLDAGSSVRICKIVRRGRGLLYLHDRFLQVDNSYTYVFTAGTQCFFENQGATNRNCHIYRLNVTPDFEPFEFDAAERNGGQLRITIRT